MIMKVIRSILGKFILFADLVTRPKKLERSETSQKSVDEKTKNLSLYQFHSCPFCVRVRRAIRKLNLNIELRDAKNNSIYKQELITEGQSSKVPCLRIEEDDEVKWLYESLEIVKYLNVRFGE